jgi:alpha-galactosidase
MKLKLRVYPFGDLNLYYLLDEESGHMSMALLPKGMEPLYEKRRKMLEIPELRRSGFTCPAWSVGSLCHLSLRHRPQSGGAGQTLRCGDGTLQLKYQEQSVFTSEGRTDIVTVLRAEEGYEVRHTVSHFGSEPGFEVQTVFENHTGKPVTLELLTSFSLDNLSPFAVDDGPERLILHRFRGGWSLEGKHCADTAEALNLERSWYNARTECERFGSLGSFPVDRFFPFAAVEDRREGVFWGAQLAHNASWQMEFCRQDDTFGLSGGLPDSEFGAWFKTIADGESFAAPKAFVSAAKGSLDELCSRLTALHLKYAALQPACEQNLPIICNEWCTSWGHPTEGEMLRLAERLRGTPVKYLVIDAGWSKSNDPDNKGQGGNGDWVPDEAAFPHGLRWLSRQLRGMGFVLGIWFEFEVTTAGACVFGKEFDALHLQRGGEVIVTGSGRSFWDFRRPEVIAYLREKVSDFLREGEIGYLKVDYNGSIGIGCDGAESLGEGLRQQMAAVREFFLYLRRAQPDLVIESCASGGHRIEPSMTDITAVTASSDAHECRETPVIAASTALMMPPRQNLIMGVMDQDASLQELRFRLCQCFFGRMSMTGDLLEMNREQWDLISEAFRFYESCVPVLQNCGVRLYRRLSSNMRHLRGLQAGVLSGENGMTLLVCHSFAEPGAAPLTVPLPDLCQPVRIFGPDKYCTIDGQTALVSGMPENDSFAMLLQKT